MQRSRWRWRAPRASTPALARAPPASSTRAAPRATAPPRAPAPAILEHFAQRCTPAHAAVELAHLAGHPTFERPYGWAWLLRLQDALRDLDAAEASEAGAWATALEPLAALVRERWIAHLAL